jgi:VWFA-related protein
VAAKYNAKIWGEFAMAMRRSWFRATLLAVALAGLLASPLCGQNSPPAQSSPETGQSAQPFTFQLNVNRVILDVVVNDANGKPVSGLTKQDFSIYEDGQPQQILSFDLHTLDSNPSHFAKLPPMPPNTYVNVAPEPERGPLYVLLLDLVNTEQDDQPYARQQLQKFVNSKPQGTRFAVFVLSDSLHLVQGFSADRAQLYKTLDPGHSIPHVPRIFLLGRNYGKGDPLMMVTVLKLIALYLDGLPGRKNIIWAAGNFPVDLFPHNDDRPDTRAETTEALDALTRAECAIYPVDLSGVVPFPPGRLTGATTARGGVGNLPGAPPPNPRPLASEMAMAGGGTSVSDNNTIQNVLAEMTGGRAFFGRNDIGNMLEEATEAGSDYYTLTYSPSNHTFDGKLRRIQVELASQGYHLEYRREYLATAPQSAILPAHYRPRKGSEEDLPNLRAIGDSLSAYMQHGAPTARDVYFRAHVRTLTPPHLATAEQMANLVDQPTYFRVRQKQHPQKPLAPIKLETYMVEYQIIARIPNLEVAAGVYDDEGRLLNGDVEEATSADPKPYDRQAKFTYFRVQQKIDAPLNSVSLRLGVRDLSTDRMGTLEIPLPLAPEP